MFVEFLYNINKYLFIIIIFVTCILLKCNFHLNLILYFGHVLNLLKVFIKAQTKVQNIDY